VVNSEKFVLDEEKVIFNVSRLRVISVEFFNPFFLFSLSLRFPTLSRDCVARFSSHLFLVLGPRVCCTLQSSG
jgi:hypothetical protein